MLQQQAGRLPPRLFRGGWFRERGSDEVCVAAVQKWKKTEIARSLSGQGTAQATAPLGSGRASQNTLQRAESSRDVFVSG